MKGFIIATLAIILLCAGTIYAQQTPPGTTMHVFVRICIMEDCGFFVSTVLYPANEKDRDLLLEKGKQALPELAEKKTGNKCISEVMGFYFDTGISKCPKIRKVEKQ